MCDDESLTDSIEDIDYGKALSLYEVDLDCPALMLTEMFAMNARGHNDEHDARALEAASALLELTASPAALPRTPPMVAYVSASPTKPTDKLLMTQRGLAPMPDKMWWESIPTRASARKRTPTYVDASSLVSGA